MNLSIIISLLNEAESLSELTEWIVRVCEKESYQYEIIFIDDGSTDDSWKIITDLKKKHTPIKAIRFQKNYGKSAALNEGFYLADGDIVITMDADLQDSPDEIPALYQKMLDGKFDILSGWKKKRYDNMLTKNLPSRLFNATTRKLTGIKLHDFNCGLKAYKKEVVKTLEVYGEMHRYIPVLASKNGFKKIGEMAVKHQVRKYGYSKFGWSRFSNGFLDLCMVLFMTKFGRRPMHFFGLYGMLAFLVGFSFTTYLIVLKFGFDDIGIITNRISLYIALIAIVIGIQLFLAGFISELVLVNSVRGSRSYIVRERI